MDMEVKKHSTNQRKKIAKKLAQVFNDVDSHVFLAKLIQSHLVEKMDIRELALKGLDFSGVHEMIDLGCGFGFFTKGLKNHVSNETKITGVDFHSKYKQHYLNACKEVGLYGNFLPDGISILKSIEANTFDLALCSYALYFFPDYIDQIARIIKHDGTFVAITHSAPHMIEFTSYVKKTLKNSGFNITDPLPYEELIAQFSNENGKEMLLPWFRNVECKEIKSSLLFRNEDFPDFEKYIRFKQSFFIPGNNHEAELLTEILLEKIKFDLQNSGEMKISKEDIIFICTGPKF